MRGAALQHDIGLDVCQTARRVEQPTDGVTGLQKQQRVGRKADDVDHPGATDLERLVACGQHLVRRQDERLEPAMRPLIMPDADVNLAAFQHRDLFEAKRFDHFDVHVGKPLGVSRQESRQNTFDRVGWGRHPQCSAVAAPKQPDALAEPADLTEDAAAVAEQLLADGREHKAAPDTVEKVETELLLEIEDLPRQGGLADPKAQRCLGDRAELGDGDESLQAPQIHALTLSPICIREQKNYALDTRAALRLSWRASPVRSPRTEAVAW